MSESAIDRRRQRTARTIAICARQLTAEHGLDGFTMDQLAECAGVSRRTLFNYVPGKVDAVIGNRNAPDPSLLAEFRAGGPTGHLLTDVVTLVRSTLEAENTDPAEVDALRRLLRSEPRLFAAVHERLVKLTEAFSQVIVEREGHETDPIVSRILTGFIVGLLDIALDESLADTRRSLTEHLDHVLEVAFTVFDGQPD